MKLTLLQWICCPACTGALTLASEVAEGEDILEGSLTCRTCGVYPVRRGIPRLLASAKVSADPGFAPANRRFHRAQARTRKSFGFQWTKFAGMYQAFEANFLNYVAPLQPDDFRDRLVLDAGCGFGRHLYYAATYGAQVIGIDFSDAIESAQRNAEHLPGVHLVQCDIYQLPFREGIFDVVYSIGVLHHLPDPEAGFRNVVERAKPEGMVAIWVYSSMRRGMNAMLETARAVTTRLPLPVLHMLSWCTGVIDWWGFILPYRVLHAWPVTRGMIERLAWPRIKLYAWYPLEVCVADWFDRLAAPIRFYYDPAQLKQWAEHNQLADVRISPTGAYGWRLFGRRAARQRQAVTSA